MREDFQAILKALPDAVLVIDRFGVVVDYKEGDDIIPEPRAKNVLGATLEEIFPSDLAAQLKLTANRALADRRMIEVEYSLRRERESMVFEARMIPHGEDSVMALIRNITERKQAEESLRKAYDELEYRVEERTAELAAANKRLEEMQLQLVQTEKMAALTGLVAGIAHELNTPVGIVRSNLDLLRRAMEKLSDKLTLSSDESLDCRRELSALTQSAQSTSDAAERINEVVTRLSAFVRLDAPELEFVDIHAGIEAAVALTDHLRGERIQLVRQYRETPRVWCYSGRINYALMNIISNAVNAIEDDGTITITTERSGDGVKVGVADTGVGIPEERLASIFDPSFSRAGKRVRAGLGLPIVYSCINDHGGKVEIDSELGRGTTVWITLPAKPPSSSKPL